MTAPAPAPLPDGFELQLDTHVRRLDGGRSLLGGNPARLLRLTPAGARLVASWQAGEPPTGPAARALARRLVDARVAHPRPPAGLVPRSDVTVVVPVRDREAQLERCLAALDAAGAPLLVVDDGSRDARAIARVAARHGGGVVRHERSRGASAARNSGLARSTTPFVAFVDSDCLPSPGWLDRLAAHLADPQVAAAAPRIVAAPASRTTWLARFEAERSPLDMGALEGAVATLSRLPYVPSATLVVRRAAVGGGFDETMPIGEDIDLVWRMVDDGWTVRYDPSIAVAHDHRVRLAPWLQRRFVYGTSAAALSRRHPGALPVAVVTPWAAATWALVAARRPTAAVAAAVGSAALLQRRLSRRALPASELLRLLASGLGWSGWSLAVALTRSWLPLSLLAAARSRRARRFLLLASVLPRAIDVRRNARALPLPAALAATTADDAAYAAGLWWGCLRERTVAPLLPRLQRMRRHARRSRPSPPP